MNYNYTDEQNIYEKIETTKENNKLITKIYKKDNTTVTGTYENLRVRLPKRSEVSDFVSGTNEYLYDYLQAHNNVTTTTHHISGIYGYWTSCS